MSALVESATRTELCNHERRASTLIDHDLENGRSAHFVKDKADLTARAKRGHASRVLSPCVHHWTGAADDDPHHTHRCRVRP